MAGKEVDIICKICNKEFKTIFSFTGHLRNHSMTSKQYYDKYVKEEGEGICPTCGKETNFNSFTEGYHKFCSISCLNKSDYHKEKSKETSLRKWGVPYPKQSKEYIELLREYNLEKFGYEWAIATPDVREKIDTTVQERYGVSNVFADEEVKQKLRKTQEEKYGGTGVGSPTIRAKIEETNLRKYGVSNVFASEEVIEKLHNIREEWIEKFEQENDVTLGMKLFEMFGTGFMQAKVVEPIVYNGSRFYKNSDIPYIEKCVELAKHNNVSLIEADVKCFVSNVFDIETNTRKIISPYELDIFVPDKKLAIEIDGVYWHSTNWGKPIDSHIKKTLACERIGIRLIHINDFEWVYKKDITKSIILSALGIYEDIINVEDCVVREVGLSESNKFLENNSIYGSDSPSYQLGLYYNNNLVQLVTFINDGDGLFKLSRVCSKLNTLVLNGFDKLMKLQPFDIVHSSIDRSKFVNETYTDCGWKVVGTTEPSCSYYKRDELIRAEQLSTELVEQLLGDKFNPSETTEQNMMRNNYLQIFDCGTVEVLYRKETTNGKER